MRKLISKILITLLIVTSIFPYLYLQQRLVVIGSIDFGEKPELYDTLKKATLKDKDHRKYMFFDDDDKKDKDKKDKDEKDNEKKAWIVWWDKNLNI